ncbi:MAG: hypothetical protein ACD_63C00173G0004 [uncultured bacterium]|nr:MAG: hypothetical protein ACD_63C00173G0004 [uncultured bacterium]
MKISLNWLKKYVDIEMTPEKLAESVTVHIVEVDGFEKSGIFEGVVVGKVLKVSNHPNADKLKLAVVDVGKKKLNIVCGAPNLAEGQIVPVALPGTVLSGNFKIKKKEVRGEMSYGMICAEDELGISKNHDEIIVLDEKKYKIGEPFAINDDVVLQIENKAIPHRPDLMGHLGMAREVAAIEKKDVKFEEHEISEIKVDEKKVELKVSVEDEKFCKRYAGVVLDGVKVGQSPDWLKNALESIGVRSINNIVDITNYITWDLGQPLHAFDAEKITGNEIKVRFAEKGEKLLTIDNKKHGLDSDMLVIADSKKPIAFAGIMGGKESEVTDGTSKIILEVANFDGYNIRNTSRKTGLTSDASLRFAKDPDPNMVDLAIHEAVSMLKELASAKVVSEISDFYPKKIKPWNVEISLKKLNNFIGVEISKEKVLEILKFLNLKTRENGDKLEIIIPTYRRDLKIPEDIFEEVARTYGYANIPQRLVRGEIVPPRQNMELYWRSFAKNLLVASGFDEIYTYSFTSEAMIKRLGLNLEGHIKVKNPVSPDAAYMQASLIPGVLESVELNLKTFDEFNLFELGKIFYTYDTSEEVKFKEGMWEGSKLCGAMVNCNPRKSKGGKVRSESFLKAKGIVEFLLKKMGMNDLRFIHLDVHNITFHPGRTAIVQVKTKTDVKLDQDVFEEVGFIGEVHPVMLEKFDIKDGAVVILFDLDFYKLSKLASEKQGYKEITKFPSVTLDVAFVLDKKVSVSEVIAMIGGAGDDFVENIELFDTYEGKEIGKNKKSLAFHIVYKSSDRTLTDKEVHEQHARVVGAVKDKFGAEVRE